MREFPIQIKGIVLSILIGSLSYGFVLLVPDLISSIILALVLGMLIGNFFRIPEDLNPGISYTSGKLLELAILFLAFSINYTHISEIGATSFSIIAIMVFLVIVATYFLAKKMHCPGSTGWLVGFGTAICGSSAIAALAPSVAKNKEDVGIAMAVVNLLGSLGMVTFPFILTGLGISETQMGLFIGGSLHSVGNVAGSAYALSDGVGEAAITIKLARVAMLSPGLIFFNYLINRGQNKSWKQHFRLPWYLWSFIGITLLGTFIQFPDWFLELMHTGGKIILTVAMAAIGLKISFQTLFKSGRKGFIFGLVIFGIQLLILVALIFSMRP